ncbi:MAG: MXAN_2562 family outer membrane beta-barrel protein [Archangium sp.]|nr:MXAN_2562 family outer membrane beta-barrel protein [Archangium sp.]
MKTSLTLACALVASVASAQEHFELSGSKKRLESPRSMYFEAKLSPYTPLLDRPFMDLPEEQRPYYAVFGGGAMLLGEIEFDYQFFQKFGSLAGGLSVGYSEKFGLSIDAVSGQRVDQSTGLRIVPIKALLVYRFDWAKEKFHVPLVPYVKAAFVVMPWWVVNGGSVELSGIQRGEGVKFGLSGVLGLALELDFLDNRLARDFDSSVGVNHTYLFAEGTLQEMNLFAATARAIDLSSAHFMFGLGFEF